MREFHLDQKGLPLVISPDSPEEQSSQFLTNWVLDQRNAIKVKLQQAGAILFRGFLGTAHQEFQQVVHAFQPRLRNYIEGFSSRHKVVDHIYTSTHYPSSETITLHNELAFTKCPPRYLFFFCQVPPDKQGETLIIDCRLFLQQLPPQVQEAFIGRGILYVCRMHGGNGFGKSWMESFATTRQEEVEKHLATNDVEFQWDSDNSLRIRRVTPTITTHPDTKEPIWFNNASLFHVTDRGTIGTMLVKLLGESNLPTHAYFENGDPIPDQWLSCIRQISWENAQFIAWQPGDLLMLDNFLVAHGRNRYTGDRRILVAMA